DLEGPLEPRWVAGHADGLTVDEELGLDGGIVGAAAPGAEEAFAQQRGEPGRGDRERPVFLFGAAEADEQGGDDALEGESIEAVEQTAGDDHGHLSADASGGHGVHGVLVSD